MLFMRVQGKTYIPNTDFQRKLDVHPSVVPVQENESKLKLSLYIIALSLARN